MVALAALGFVMIMKATGIANFAQGDLITLGALPRLCGRPARRCRRTTASGLSLGLGYLLVLVIMFVFGVGIERVAYAPLSKRATTSTWS